MDSNIIAGCASADSFLAALNAGDEATGGTVSSFAGRFRLQETSLILSTLKMLSIAPVGLLAQMESYALTKLKIN